MARMEANMNEMDTTLEEASDAGKYSDFSMKCMTTSVHHLKASVIRILGKIGSENVNFLIDSGSTHCFMSPKLARIVKLDFDSFIKRPIELAYGKKNYT